MLQGKTSRLVEHPFTHDWIPQGFALQFGLDFRLGEPQGFLLRFAADAALRVPPFHFRLRKAHLLRHRKQLFVETINSSIHLLVIMWLLRKNFFLHSAIKIEEVRPVPWHASRVNFTAWCPFFERPWLYEGCLRGLYPSVAFRDALPSPAAFWRLPPTSRQNKQSWYLGWILNT